MDERMQKMKEKELDMLRIFLHVCGELGLRHYVIGGTLLGAVRHQGFIPWDDDIDVALPREDYDRFVAEAQAHLPDWCFLQNYHTEPEFPFIFSKLRDSRSTFFESSLKELPINQGIYIDVFPIDYVPDQNRERFDRKNFFLKIRANYGLNLRPSFKVRVLQRLTLLRWPRLRDALEQREALFRGVGPSGHMANLCGSWGKREVVPAAWFGQGTPLPFEGLTVIGPSDYDAYLRNVYGDYMQLPPIEKQVGHHYNEGLEPELPYTEYLAGRVKEKEQP